MLRRSGAAAFAAAFSRLENLPNPKFLEVQGEVGLDTRRIRQTERKNQDLKLSVRLPPRRNRKIWADGKIKKEKDYSS